MMKPRPICTHCGAAYGRRHTTDHVVRWSPSETPPPYQGNGILVKESAHWVGADGRGMGMYRYVWNGETWAGGYEPFCALRCALNFARKAYKAGFK